MNEIIKHSDNERLPISEIEKIAKYMVASGYFVDAKDVAQAVVKIMAGDEVGIRPFNAMNGINIIKGKPVLGSGLLASLIRRSGVYDYVVDELNDNRCALSFYRGSKLLGQSVFSLNDAKRSGAGSADMYKTGHTNLEKFSKNILFARAMSNGAKWYCPDIFVGQIAVPEEIGDDVVDGEVTEPRNTQKEASDRNGTSERPYSPEEFSAQYKLLVAKLEVNGTVATDDQRRLLGTKLVAVFDNEEDEQSVLVALTGWTSVAEMTDAQVVGLLRVMGFRLAQKDENWTVSDVARAELLGVLAAVSSVDDDTPSLPSPKVLEENLSEEVINDL